MKKLFKTYILAIKNTFYAMKRSWVIIPLCAILFFVSSIVTHFLLRISPSSGFSVGGFLAGMFLILALSIFYNWLYVVSSNQKLKFSDIKNLDISFFNPILNVAFILFIVNLLAGTLFATNKNLIIILNFIIVILCNSIPECIILKSLNGTETIVKSFHFIKKNYIEWFLPYIVFFLPLILIDYTKLLVLLGINDVLIPGNTLYKGSAILLSIVNFTNPFIVIPISFVIALFFSIFRIYLYDALDRD